MALPKLKEFVYKWRERGIVAKGKIINKQTHIYIYNQIREIQYYFNTSREAQSKK